MLVTLVVLAVGVKNVKDLKTRRTSGFVDWDPSINPMDSTQEMKSKQGPESTSDSLENKFKNFYYKIYTFTTTNLHQPFTTNLTLSVITFLQFHSSMKAFMC